MEFLHRLTITILASSLLLGLSSCDKIKELASSDETETKSVDSISEKSAKELISEEDRLVVVEFYTDT